MHGKIVGNKKKKILKIKQIAAVPTDAKSSEKKSSRKKCIAAV
jgi:hypothetical protein